MKVVYSQLALIELDQILTYIGMHSPRGAGRLEARLRHVIDRIAHNPQSLRELQARRGSGERRSCAIPTSSTTR